MENYTANLENRKVQKNGSISYDLIITNNETGETLIDTDYTVEPRQEEREDFEQMVRKTAEKRVKAINEEIGEDHSGNSIEI